MAYLDATKIAEILNKIGGAALRRHMRTTILPEIATAIATDAAAGLEDMPAVPGDVEANKIAQLGANKEINEVHAEAFYLGAGAGTLVSSTAAELNILGGVTANAADINKLDGLTKSTAELNALASNPGLVALAGIRVEAAVQDGETVTIGADIYEFDTEDVENVGEGHIAVDVSGGSTVKAEGLLTVAVQPIAGDTMTIGSKVYTFVPQGTANADGEVNVGADLPAAKLNIVNAIEGDDGWNDPDPLVTCAAAFSTNDLVITAIKGGTVGNAYASTETFDDVGNIFDAATMGTETAGVDPTAGEASDALLAAIDDSGTEPVVAVDIDANEVLLMQEAVGVDTTALAEDMAGGSNTVDAAFADGAAASSVAAARAARVPTAQEVGTGNLHIALDFVPTFAFVQVRTTATGAVVAWDGALIITGGDNPYITVDNSGDADWSVNETIYVIAFA